MTDDLNSVKTAARSYHHGALRPALLAAAESVIAERGVDGFSLRETARRAGVSPAAPAHHFGDARGLLTALATEAFRQFGDALEAADAGGSRIERLRAQGQAYVRFAMDERARFDLMWRYTLLDPDDPDYQAATQRAYAILDRAARGRPHRPGEPVEIPAAIAAWSMVHGFARLILDGAFGNEEGAAERAARDLLPQVLGHLRV
jgi:AcrR family transcriptional regulator